MSTPPRFDSLGLSPRSLSAIARVGWSAPTPIQQRAIPPALAGQDVIGCAATGTGKTGAFLLPILEKVRVGQGSRALVLAPTRELALQIAEQLEALGQGSRVRGATVIGGVGMQPQADALREGREVIVATPGRLIDHLAGGAAKLGAIELLVLDEADRMLDMGFKPQLERILRKLPPRRQTLLFSATMAGEVADFAARYLVSPAKVEVARSGTTASRAEQRMYLVPKEEKTALLLALLSEDEKSTLVFTRTKRRADRVARSLERQGLEVARIHADRSQAQRRQALEGFRAGTYRVLVATDIAARGIDVEEIGHVVNYDLPNVPADYVHRIGRTARAAASGLASSFCAPDEQAQLRDIEKLLRVPVPRAEVPRSSPIFQEEVSRRADHERDPGPPMHHHGQGRRRRGGARSPGSSTGASSGSSGSRPGGGGSGESPSGPGGTRRSAGSRSGGSGRSGGAVGATATPTGARVGSWRPRRKR